MEEQLISFETAKLAKEKDFNIKCDYLFLNDVHEKGGSRDTDGWKPRCLNWNSEYFDNVRNGDIQYSQPTQSLLQKWLREEHNLHIEIRLGFSLIEYFWEINEIKPQIFVKKQDKVNLFNYEQALEKGLYEALKLIK